MHSPDKTIIVTILDNLIYYLSAFILKDNSLPTLLNNNNILPFLSLWFSFVSLSISHIGSQCFCFLFFLYQDTDYIFTTLYIILAEKMFFILIVIWSQPTSQGVINTFQLEMLTHRVSVIKLETYDLGCRNPSAVGRIHQDQVQ